jgi:hypothetical protein
MTANVRKQGARLSGRAIALTAIVLAVVGGVIGAIWVAAANMIENHRVNKTVDALMLAVTRTQNFLSYNDAMLATGGNGVITMAGSIAEAANLIPVDWVKGTGGLQHPWQGVATLSADMRYNPPYISMGLYQPMPDSACAKLAVKVSSMAAAAAGKTAMGGVSNPLIGMIQFDFSGTTGKTTITTFPISLEQATNYCKMRVNKTISFYWGFTRINN